MTLIQSAMFQSSKYAVEVGIWKINCSNGVLFVITKNRIKLFSIPILDLRKFCTKPPVYKIVLILECEVKYN